MQNSHKINKMQNYKFYAKKSTNDAKYSKNAEKLSNTYICTKVTSSCYTMLVRY